MTHGSILRWRLRVQTRCIWLACAGTGFASAEARAHVRYRDLDAAPILVKSSYSGGTIDDPCAGRTTGCQSSNAFTRYGWLKGTEPTLGNSHNLSIDAEFWKFHLDEPATVKISFIQSESNLDPAFSLYSGLLPISGHDDTPVDPLTPVDGSGCAVASPKDAHDTPYDYVSHDGYRDTLAYSTTGGLSDCRPVAPFFGQFDAFAGWSMANPSGAWSRIEYVASVSAAPFTGHAGGTHAEGNHATDPGTGETLTIALPAGDYTIAAAGEACSATTGACGAIRYGTISYERIESDAGSTPPPGGAADSGAAGSPAPPMDASTGGRPGGGAPDDASEPPRSNGVRQRDAGITGDASSAPSGPRSSSGTTKSTGGASSGGCNCALDRGAPPRRAIWLTIAAALGLVRRSRRDRARDRSMAASAGCLSAGRSRRS